MVGYDGLSPGGNGDELSILLSLWPRALSNEQTLSFFAKGGIESNLRKLFTLLFVFTAKNVVRTRFSQRCFPPDTLYFFSLLLTVSPWKIKDRKNKRVDTFVTHARVPALSLAFKMNG